MTKGIDVKLNHIKNNGNTWQSKEESHGNDLHAVIMKLRQTEKQVSKKIMD